MITCLKHSAEASGGAAVPAICGDDARLSALHGYGFSDLPAAEYPPEFDAVTQLAAAICDVPMSLVSLVDKQRQFFLGETGLGVRETSLDKSICAHALLEEDFLEVPDVQGDKRFEKNPLVSGAPYLRFYAGSVLRAPTGEALGSLCVLDTKPRQITPEQREALRTLGRHVGSMLELRRISERLRAAEARERVAREHAESVSRQKDRFFATLSHELRAPLTPALMAVQMLESDDSLSEESRKDVEMIRRNLEQEVRLVDDLLDVNRASGGKLTLELTTESIDTLVASVCDDHAKSARAAGVALTFEPGAVGATAQCDAGRIGQVVSNLLRNAIKFTPTGGAIVVSTFAAEGEATISVADTGGGIGPELLPRVFEPFEQGQAAGGRQGGLGLGLAICRGIVDAHGGSIVLHSDGPGHGTRATVRLPLNSASAVETR